MPSAEQQGALSHMEHFLTDPDSDVFVLQGAAGTGKTSLTKAVTGYLHEQGIRFHLVAPTGRAAQIISQKTGFTARTIHSLIYTPETLEDHAAVRMVRKTNEENEPGVYVVDEASMVSNLQNASDTFITPRPLLTDLVDFVKQGNTRNKLLFIGDKYQLPPVNEPQSRALEAAYLAKQFGLIPMEAELSQVMRQREGSYILENATRLRKAMETGLRIPKPQMRQLANPEQNVDRFLDSRDPNRSDAATMMAFTNRDVNQMNRMCRQRLGVENQVLAPGEPVVLHRPWAGAGHWLVNGEQGIIRAVGSSEHYAGLKFVEVEVVFSDEEGREFVVKALALADVLQSEKGLLSREQEQALYHKAITDNRIFRQSRRLSDDMHVGALRMRYGYALTAHKAQGGEWDRVFLHPYLSTDPRWQYTAVTRARVELYSYQHPYTNCNFITFMN